MTSHPAKNCFALVSVLLFLLCLPVSAAAAGPAIISHEITNATPTIDGTVGAGEWPGSPQIVFDENTPPTDGFNYVTPTYVYFYNNLEYIYVLVDVVGDTTNDTDCPACDECLLIFAYGDEFVLAEGFGNANSCPDEAVFAAGLGTSQNSGTAHRIYEWRIPLSAINAEAGQIIDFCSPHESKYQCYFQNDDIGGSLGYDADTGNDNIWPPGLVGAHDMTEGGRDDWGTLQLQPTQIQSIPTLNEWGTIMLCLILAGGAVWAMKRRTSFSA